VFAPQTSALWPNSFCKAATNAFRRAAFAALLRPYAGGPIEKFEPACSGENYARRKLMRGSDVGEPKRA
jgi:hypothetical protein